jgi:N-ethylmaleimide reductase
MSEADVKTAIGEFEHAAKNAVAAGFDGIELHGGNGYLLEQFFRRPPTRARCLWRIGREPGAFLIDVIKATSAAIGKDKVGIRLSPFGVLNDMPLYPELEADYTYLAESVSNQAD